MYNLIISFLRIYLIDLEMDVRNMNFEPDSFDLVIDKACMDCIFCGENSFENC